VGGGERLTPAEISAPDCAQRGIAPASLEPFAPKPN